VTLDNFAQYNQHVRCPEDKVCDLQMRDWADGIDRHVASRLSKRHQASGSVEDDWKALWSELFPGDSPMDSGKMT
jgi:hypothetical protein